MDVTAAAKENVMTKTCPHETFDHGKQVSWWSLWYEIYDHDECFIGLERKCFRCQKIERNYEYAK